MRMQNPPHPGGIVKRQCLDPLGLRVTRAAKGLGVTRRALSALINERSGISIEMAIRLSKVFGSTPETWLGMQIAYDLWQARSRARVVKVEEFASGGQYKSRENSRRAKLEHEEPISRDPAVLSGTAVFPRTRVPVGILFEYLADGHSINVFTEQFPTVSRAHAIDLLNYVRKDLHEDDNWYSIEDSPSR